MPALDPGSARASPPPPRPTTPRVLVTGGTGFVGRHLLPELQALGFDVHATARTPLPLPAVTWHPADLLDPATPARLIADAGPTHLVHLAWDVTPGRYWTSPSNLDWVAASLRLYRAFAQAGGRRMLGVGTCAEYDWSTPLLDEAVTPCRPATLYGTAKHALHQLLAATPPGPSLAPSLAWARLFFLYGPHEPPNRLVSGTAAALLAGQPALCGDGRPERDFMHVADVARALALVLASAHKGPINIASGDCRPLRDIIDRLGALCAQPGLIRLGARPTPPGEPPRMQAATAILHGQLGFTPRHTLDAGLADTVAWWRAHPPTTFR